MSLRPSARLLHSLQPFHHRPQIDSHRLTFSRVLVFSTSTSTHHHHHQQRLTSVSHLSFTNTHRPSLIKPAAMATKTTAAHYGASPAPGPQQNQQKKKPSGPPPEPRPSASIVLVSPTNQILLLHRVKTSSAFPSAHVFPGGNLSDFHDGPVPPPTDPARHEDSLAYRLGAIRETFEESGILLARRKDADAHSHSSSSSNNQLLNLPTSVREAARKAVYGNTTRFVDWLDSVGGSPDTENLHPFTRWVTPAPTPRRFTTQMYLYMIPITETTSSSSSSSSSSTTSAAAAAVDLSSSTKAAAEDAAAALIPTPDSNDGSGEITTARFDDAKTWLDRQTKGEVILFPPQCYLLHLLSEFLVGVPSSSSSGGAQSTPQYYNDQRKQVLEFLHRTPTTTTTTTTTTGERHPTASIPWAQKVMSPVTMGMSRRSKKAILTLDRPGPELEKLGSKRGGDYERVVLVNFAKGGPRDVEVRWRAEVVAEERELNAKI